MADIEIDLNPVNHITTDAIGEPGKRVFYLQGRKGEQVVTLIAEKVQVQAIANGIEGFLAELDRQYPGLTPAAGDYSEAEMHITPPVDPLFRIGQLGLAYDGESDRVIIIAHEIEMGDAPAAAEEAEEEPQGNVVRFWCTRAQLLALGRWGNEVASRGRPTCPYCGTPIGPEGHFCPKKNGHKH